MQKASRAYKTAMKKPLRNRACITARIGIISSVAQDNVVADEKNNDFAYFANNTLPFESNTVDRVYATGEQDFSHVDGTMYFLPHEGDGFDYYNNGLVSNELLGSLYISFNGNIADIKGLTIDFGECYPTSFKVVHDHGENEYSNSAAVFITEDPFDAVSFLQIVPLAMVNGQGRLRIDQFTCGISNTFSNKQVKNFTYKDYASEISDCLPSQDMTLTVDNQNLYYDPNDKSSAVSYLEQGQEMKVRLGYDVNGDGTIEWMPDYVAYLKSWSATDTEAKFNMVDVFDWKMGGTYYKGQYRADGISLYDLAVDVFTDAGMEADGYEIDSYLKTIKVYNPMPTVSHAEAVQIIANSGRCILSADRSGKVKLFASFIPDMSTLGWTEGIYPELTLFPGESVFPEINSGTAFGAQSQVLLNNAKEAYAMASNDFSMVDGSVRFFPRDNNYLSNIGYVSEEVSDSKGMFDNNPTITIFLEAAATFFGFTIKFRNVAPKEFVIYTYNQDVAVQTVTIQDPDLECEVTDEFDSFDKIILEFKKGYPNARVTVDNVLFGNMSDFSIDYDLSRKSPTATQEEKVAQVDVVRSIYSTTDEVKNIFQEKIDVTDYDTYTFYFSDPSYDVTVTVNEEDLEIIDSSSYFATVNVKGLTGEQEFSVNGKNYAVAQKISSRQINVVGITKTWENPLISEPLHAEDVAEWLGNYYYNNIKYDVTYAGDPRVDAGDLIALENRRSNWLNARIYQNEISFNGAFSGTAKIKKTVSQGG